MKKRIVFIISLIILICNLGFIFSEEDITGQIITGEAVTGKALQSSLALNITVTYPVPIISIISPENETYLRNDSVFINYSSINADEIWYNLDSGSNITLSGPVYANISQGLHTLYFYANNSYGEFSTETVSFAANSSFLTILYSEYNGSTKGNSTDFLAYTYEDLQNLDEITLENTIYGKMKFNNPINITNDLINNDNLVDFDSNTNISFNRIELNPTAFPNFNTSATIWLYNLSFNNPRILRNGVLCPTSECIKESYTFPSEGESDGILRFYVTHFTTYSLEETPSTNPPSGGGGGGGGSSSSEDSSVIIPSLEEEDNITLISDEVRISLKPGQYASEDFYLMNNYENILDAELSVYGVEDFMSLSETKVSLPYKEIKLIKINFSIPKDTSPDTYVGRITVSAGGKTYEAIVSIDVQSQEYLFDVSLNIDKDNLPVYPGDYILFKTSIYNIGEDEVDASLIYTIKDSYGKIIFEGNELEKISGYFEKEGKIKIPKRITPGKYILSAKVESGDKTAVTSTIFDVEKKKISWFWILIISLLVILGIFFLLWLIGKSEEKKRKREKEDREEKLRY
ncbi:MAG: hypothetical protein ACP5NZ_03590 [Nanobdellota archaeon]